MAYQPIQLGNNIGLTAGMQSVTESLADLANWRRQRGLDEQARKQQEYENERRKRYEFQQAYATARNLAEKGDMAGAQAIMAPYADANSMRFVDEHAEAAGLKKDLGFDQKPQAFAGGSAVPDQMEPGTQDYRQFGQQAVADLVGQPPKVAGMTTVRGTPLPMFDQAAAQPQQPQQQQPSLEQFMQQAAQGKRPNDALTSALAQFGGNGNQAMQYLAQRSQDRPRRYLEFMMGGKSMRIDPDAQREEELRRQNEDRARVAERLLPVVGEQHRDMLQGLVTAGVDPEKALGPFLERRMADMQREEQAGRADDTMSADSVPELYKRYGAEVVAGVRSGQIKPGTELEYMAGRLAADQAHAARLAAANRSRGGGPRQPRPPGEGANRDDARTDLNAYLSQTDYKGTLRADAEFRRMLALAQANNPFTDRALIGSWTKMAQGGAGVLTDSDINNFWNRAGSPKERTENYLEQALTGKFGDARRNAVRSAIQSMASVAQSRLSTLERGARELMAPYKENGQRWMNAYFGESAPSSATEKKGKAHVDDIIGKYLP